MPPTRIPDPRWAPRTGSHLGAQQRGRDTSRPAARLARVWPSIHCPEPVGRLALSLGLQVGLLVALGDLLDRLAALPLHLVGDPLCVRMRIDRFCHLLPNSPPNKAGHRGMRGSSSTQRWELPAHEGYAFERAATSTVGFAAMAETRIRTGLPTVRCVSQ